jgi:hypothetical protein
LKGVKADKPISFIGLCCQIDDGEQNTREIAAHPIAICALRIGFNLGHNISYYASTWLTVTEISHQLMVAPAAIFGQLAEIQFFGRYKVIFAERVRSWTLISKSEHFLSFLQVVSAR